MTGSRHGVEQTGGHLLRKIIISGACLVACSSSSGDDTGSGSDVGDLLGTFQVELVEPTSDTPGYTAVLGKVFDGLQPDTVTWTEAASAGGCVLRTPSVPFCSPSCTSGSACVAANTCQPYPTSKSVGTVRLKAAQTASGSKDVELTAVQNSYQLPGGTMLAYPAFDEGATVEVTASGSDFSNAFTLRAKGIPPLELVTQTFALRSGQALAVEWEAPSSSTDSTIGIKLDISHHGGSKGKIECSVDDTGSTTIAASLVDQLLALGAAGYPTIIVTRRSVGHSAAATGHVDLLITGELEKPIDVPGVISCTSDDDCTAPATCQDDLTCK